VPESPPLCSVNGGRLVWRARTGVEHGARASGAGRRGAVGAVVRARVGVVHGARSERAEAGRVCERGRWRVE